MLGRTFPLSLYHQSYRTNFHSSLKSSLRSYTAFVFRGDLATRKTHPLKCVSRSRNTIQCSNREGLSDGNAALNENVDALGDDDGALNQIADSSSQNYDVSSQNYGASSQNFGPSNVSDDVPNVVALALSGNDDFLSVRDDDLSDVHDGSNEVDGGLSQNDDDVNVDAHLAGGHVDLHLALVHRECLKGWVESCLQVLGRLDASSRFLLSSPQSWQEYGQSLHPCWPRCCLDCCSKVLI